MPKTKIGEILRATALSMPRHGGYKKKSQYICDMMGAWHGDLEQQFYPSEIRAAKQFLHSLGMGCGMAEFENDFPSFKKRQEVRITWLLFAADLADEWAP